jgi:hypothetical protein
MAFTQATLAGGGGHGTAPTVFNLWKYTTADNITDLDAANYWSGAYARGMRAGDVVIAVCADGGVILHISALAATTSTAAAFA